MFKIKVCLVPGHAIDSLPHQISVVGMNALEYELQGWLKGSIILKDRMGFFRPVDVSAGNAPTEATCVAFALSLSQESLAAVEVRIELVVFERNRGLRSQHLQRCDALRGEDARSQIVLQIECADEVGLFDDRHAQDGPGALLPHILVLRVQVRGRSIIEDHTFPRPDDVLKRGLGKFILCDGCLSNSDLDSAVAGGGVCLNLRLIAPEKDEETSLSPCVLDRDAHELLDQLAKDDLA